MLSLEKYIEKYFGVKGIIDIQSNGITVCYEDIEIPKNHIALYYLHKFNKYKNNDPDQLTIDEFG